MIKRVVFFLTLLLVLPACTPKPVNAVSQERVVLASQSVTFALGSVLVKGTPIAMVRAVPDAYSPGGHAAYFKKHWEDFQSLASSADAVLCTTGVWPDDPLYPWARRANIHVVNVDATHPLDYSRAGVPHGAKGHGAVSPVWVAPGNLARMADIAGADFMQLYPEHAKRIGENIRLFKQQLFRLRSEFEVWLVAAPWFRVVALTPDFAPLLEEFGVETVETLSKPENHWTAQDVERLEGVLTDNHVHVVVCAWTPRADIAEAIARAGAQVLVLKAFPGFESPDASSVVGYYKNNLKRLLDAMYGNAHKKL